MRVQWKCGVCGEIKHSEGEMQGHMAALMETNERNDGDHPHWRELEVDHHDLSAWRMELPGVTDY